jgi:dipeptidyl aminopeptidase/acylaminoacyl peptidase
MKAPVFPMSYLLTFWGGFQNNFNAFDHKPIAYAKEIKVKTMLLYGMKDDRVSLEETESIFENLTGPKELKLFPDAGHESILMKYRNEWVKNVQGFIE